MNIITTLTRPLAHIALVLGLSTSAMAQTAVTLSDAEVDNIVRRSYQYVAMYNVIRKFSSDPVSGELFTDGFNKPKAATTLVDHTVRSIARPNNDTLYQATTLEIGRAHV